MRRRANDLVQAPVHVVRPSHFVSLLITTSERIAEDGLRILRAFRFLDLERNNLRTFDSDLENAINNNVHMLDKVSKERITDELMKILNSNNPYKIFSKMQRHFFTFIKCLFN